MEGLTNKSIAKVIAIDGPSGSGKSTVAKKVAKALNILYVDTGAMFRALAFVFSNASISAQKIQEDETGARRFLEKLNIEYGPEKDILIRINGVILDESIRLHHVSTMASEYSKIPLIRHFLLEFQRTLAQSKFCVMEGRDIGTVVFPNAFCKIFLTASLEGRARRRLLELEEKGQKNLTFEQVKEDLHVRDQNDVNRAIAPLLMAQDSILVDTTEMGPDKVLECIIGHAYKKAQSFGLGLSANV